MKQTALNPHSSRKTRKQIFLHQMDQVVPWTDLVDRISPYYPECKSERGPVQLQTLLRTHFMQQWFELSDPAMEEAFHDTPVFREFAQADNNIRLPDENTIKRFRCRLEKYKLDKHLQRKVSEKLEQHGLKLTPGSVVDATLSAYNSEVEEANLLANLIEDPLPTATAVSVPSSIKQLPDLKLFEQDSIIYLSCGPVDNQTDVKFNDLKQLIEQSVFSDCLIDWDSLKNLADQCNLGPLPFQAAIGKRVNASVSVSIAEDEMSARMNLVAAQGGKSLNVTDIQRALQVEGIVVGILDETIDKLLASGNADNHLIAVGRTAVNGTNTVFEDLVFIKPDNTADEDFGGRVDYRAQNTIPMVEAGQALMRRIPATTGVAGYTVKGRVLEALSGEDTDYPEDIPGAHKSESDPNILIALITGHPVSVANAIKVEPLLHIQEVNLSTGNIDFDGAVRIDGDVIQGMQVKATGDILIGGVVERSKVETTGDILVKGGVIGDAQLNAGGVVRARFGQSATILAVKGIELDEMAMQCHLWSQDSITVGLKVPQRGRIVGGITRALHNIKVPFLGSDEGTLTRVIVGVQEELASEFRALQFAIFDKQSSIDNLSKIVNQLTRTGDPKKMLDRAKASLQEMQNSLADMENKSQMIDDKLTQLRNSKIEVSKETTGMVEVTVANYKVRLTKGYGRGHFGLSDENRVVHIDPKGFSGLAN